MDITFAIPTFNGEKHIVESIESIRNQIGMETELSYEIVISVNGSTDSTLEILQEKYGQCPEIRIAFEFQNLGFDLNFIKLLKESHGQFIWFLGDDDYLARGCIQEVLQIIKSENRIKMIILHPQFLSSFNENNFQLMKSNKEIYKDPFEFAYKVKWGPAALSSLIFHKDSMLQNDIFKNAYKYIDNQWIHLAFFYEFLKYEAIKKRDSTYAYVTNSKVVCRINNPRWENSNGNFYLVGLKQIYLIKKLLTIGEWTVIYKILSHEKFKVNLRDLIWAQFDTQDPKTKLMTSYMMIKLYWKHPRVWAIDVPYLFLNKKLKKSIFKRFGTLLKL